MKQPAGILVFAMTFLAGSTARGTDSTPVAFDTHEGYFVSNRFEPNAAASFVAIRDQKAFDQVFGVAMVMGDKSRRLPANAFESKIVVAAIKRGKALWQFKVREVVVEKGRLTIHYTASSDPQVMAEFACPLIVSVPKGDYSAVQFEENGKVVKKVDLKGDEVSETAREPDGRDAEFDITCRKKDDRTEMRSAKSEHITCGYLVHSAVSQMGSDAGARGQECACCNLAPQAVIEMHAMDLSKDPPENRVGRVVDGEATDPDYRCASLLAEAVGVKLADG